MTGVKQLEKNSKIVVELYNKKENKMKPANNNPINGNIIFFEELLLLPREMLPLPLR